MAQRAREIGIRMAVGARPVDIPGLILQISLLLTAGAVIGAAAALAGTRLARDAGGSNRSPGIASAAAEWSGPPCGRPPESGAPWGEAGEFVLIIYC